MRFILLQREEKPPTNIKNCVCLQIDKWNDYSYVTMFYMIVFDKDGSHHNIGNIKIGFKNQTDKTATYTEITRTLGTAFDFLPDTFFSVGQDIDFYLKIKQLSDNIGNSILEKLNDVVYKDELFQKFKEEYVFKTSLMRDIRDRTITEQFKRVLENKSPLTDFNFWFIRYEQEKIGGIELNFNVVANSTPSTNIHALIGRNGVGKTTLLNGMIKAFINPNNNDQVGFYTNPIFPYSCLYKRKIGNDYFSYLVAVSFSIFDPFIPNNEGAQYYSYIGLKESESKLKSATEYFENDFWASFFECKSFSAKKERWLHAIQNLESDDNFAEMKLSRLMEKHTEKNDVMKIIRKMSSGHAAVLLIMTQLVAKVEEKTLVLLDEPESHLHPPLLSAFVRALSDLLDNRNGIAIIATHSPVVLQEIPKSCVWKIERTGKKIDPFRPNIETFGENVGVLTREVFGLEVTKSGFHKLLTQQVEMGKSYDEIISKFNNQMGTEAKILLKTLIRNREPVNNKK